MILGLFAVAEMIDLWVRGGTLAKDVPQALSARDTQKQIFKGIGLAFKNWWLVMRCSAIGTTMGLIPGLGSAPGRLCRLWPCQADRRRTRTASARATSRA